MKELIGRLLMEMYERLPIPLISRDVSITELEGKISAIIGMRRVGKTYLLYDKMGKLISNRINKEQLFYLNLEDDRLPELSKGVLTELIDGFYSLYPENHSRHCWLFFDEIQNAEDWAKVLRRLIDTKDVSIYISGSSARLLSIEIATSLRGRSIATEVWPLNILEYADRCSFKLTASPRSPRVEDETFLFLSKYLLIGGFPETINYNDLDRRRVHQDYISVVILRDIIERYEVKNEDVLRYLIKFLLSNISKPFTINKLYKDLKSQGRSLGKNTLYEYLGYISDCYLAFSIPLYTESLRKQESNPRKIYAVDTGLASSHMLGNSKNMGRLFENLIYLDFRRHGFEVSYYTTKSGNEVDFIARSQEGRRLIVQVCYNMQDAATKEREETALKEAETELGESGMIVTPENYVNFLSIL